MSTSLNRTCKGSPRGVYKLKSGRKRNVTETPNVYMRFVPFPSQTQIFHPFLSQIMVALQDDAEPRLKKDSGKGEHQDRARGSNQSALSSDNKVSRVDVSVNS